jgi:protein-S-isoprenylcysteine O-methyltransferase Ste14
MGALIDSLPSWALFAWFSVFFLFGMVLRSWLVYRRSGVNPLVLPAADDAYGYVGRAFKLCMAGCVIAVAVIAFDPQAASRLGAWPLLQHGTARSAGWLLLVSALAWMLLAQAHMGLAWRVGIDSARRTELVQHGLFALSRNPIFLAMRASLLGLLLVYPAAATLALLVAGEILVQVQVRLEEQHLNSLHGDAYRAYCARVRRWL